MRPEGGSAGRRGDFITSPEVGPLFGAVIARYLDAEWERIGRPDPFTVVDAGAGPGTLARAVLAAAPACRDALRYVAVEISPAQRARHPDGIESVPALPEPPVEGDVDGLIDGVVLANELLDNLPFRLAVFDNGWREAFVTMGSDGRFVEVLSAPFDPVPACLPVSPTFGSRAPLDRSCRHIRRRRPPTGAVRFGRRDRLRHADHRDARRSPVAGVAAHLSRQRARGPLPRGTWYAGHHDRRPDRPAPRARHRARAGTVPPAVGYRRPRGRGQARLDRAGGAARSRSDEDAQPDQRSRGAARPRRPRRFPRRRMACYVSGQTRGV